MVAVATGAEVGVNVDHELATGFADFDQVALSVRGSGLAVDPRHLCFECSDGDTGTVAVSWFGLG